MQAEKRTRRKSLPWYASVWVIGGALAFACSLSVIVYGILLATRSNPEPALSTAVLTVVTAATATMPNIETPDALPTDTPPPSPPPGEIAVGAFVQVVGTGGDGLRLRENPGLDGVVLNLGSEAEIFRVDDGPVETDGYTWWYLVGPSDETRKGWAVSNFLQVVQNP